VTRALGSFSARAGKKWSKDYADDRKRREAERLAHTEAGHAGWLISPSPEMLREAIAAQTCPACGTGPYKVLALHVHQAHGISGAEFRRMAGLSTIASICAPESSGRYRDRLEARPDREDISRRGNKTAMAASSYQAANAAWRQKNLEETAERDDLIAHLFAEGVLIRDIAQRAGIASNGVKRVLRRRGVAVDDDLHARRFENAEERRRHVEQLDRGRATFQQRAAERQQRLVAEWKTLGATFEAVTQLARRHGIDRKSMRQELVDAGCQVPDGRPIANQRWVKLTESAKRRMVQLYADGYSQDQIARQVGVGQGHISKVLRDMGVPTRPFTRAAGRR
jgi:DNA-binding MarR family transcriptional regulator